jgi:hypothetical protein
MHLSISKKRWNDINSENCLDSSHRQSWKYIWKHKQAMNTQMIYIRIWIRHITRQSHAQFSIKANLRLVGRSKSLQPVYNMLSISNTNKICVKHVHWISGKLCLFLWLFIMEQISARFYEVNMQFDFFHPQVLLQFSLSPWSMGSSLLEIWRQIIYSSSLFCKQGNVHICTIRWSLETLVVATFCSVPFCFKLTDWLMSLRTTQVRWLPWAVNMKKKVQTQTEKETHLKSKCLIFGRQSCHLQNSSETATVTTKRI